MHGLVLQVVENEWIYCFFGQRYGVCREPAVIANTIRRDKPVT
jgi:hypothetical protein